MKMRILCLFVLMLLLETTCHPPFVAPRCEQPGPVVIDPQVCYDPAQGLTIHSIPVAFADTTTRLDWTVYLIRDSLQQAPYRDAVVVTVPKGNLVTLPDSIVAHNQEVYAVVRSSCSGTESKPQTEGYGSNGSLFVRRYNRTSGCYYWTSRY